MARAEIAVFPDLQAISHAVAERVVRAGNDAENRTGLFSLVLSGGSAPLPLFDLLAGTEGDAVPWPRTELFWGDERCVPPNDERSNFGRVRDSGLLERPAAAVHRMEGELPPPEGAARYEKAIERSGAEIWVPSSEEEGGEPLGADGALAALPGGLTKLPVFDFVLLGLGEDGHTASLFSGSPALEVRDRWVTASRDPDGLDRLTLTLPVFLAAREIVYMVAGRKKAEPVRRVLEDRDAELPAAMVVRNARRVSWFLDEEAGLGLQERRASWWR